jgi:hypothetical protein
MDRNEIEIGLIKERIKMIITCLQPDSYIKRIKEHIEKDNDIDRLKNVLTRLEYYIEKQEKEMKKNQREYWNKKKIETEREVKELKKKGYDIDIELLEDFKKDCDKLGRIK